MSFRTEKEFEEACQQMAPQFAQRVGQIVFLWAQIEQALDFIIDHSKPNDQKGVRIRNTKNTRMLNAKIEFVKKFLYSTPEWASHLNYFDKIINSTLELKYIRNSIIHGRPKFVNKKQEIKIEFSKVEIKIDRKGSAEEKIYKLKSVISLNLEELAAYMREVQELNEELWWVFLPVFSRAAALTPRAPEPPPPRSP